MLGHAHGRLLNLTHSKVLKHLLGRWLLLNLLLFDLGAYFLGSDLFHSCRCLRRGLQRLALIQQIGAPTVHFFSLFGYVLSIESESVFCF